MSNFAFFSASSFFRTATSSSKEAATGTAAEELSAALAVPSLRFSSQHGGPHDERDEERRDSHLKNKAESTFSCRRPLVSLAVHRAFGLTYKRFEMSTSSRPSPCARAPLIFHLLSACSCKGSKGAEGFVSVCWSVEERGQNQKQPNRSVEDDGSEDDLLLRRG